MKAIYLMKQASAKLKLPNGMEIHIKKPSTTQSKELLSRAKEINAKDDKTELLKELALVILNNNFDGLLFSENDLQGFTEEAYHELYIWYLDYAIESVQILNNIKEKKTI
ncbi:hypothetical protein QTL86_13290 [Cellulosilyticum sp. ST5]|uniref:hypothetical protein n=1 Tax=Cellulosilyticum sp. ST5 TaxID=3055805 RepID=UPI0039779A37